MSARQLGPVSAAMKEIALQLLDLLVCCALLSAVGLGALHLVVAFK